MNACERCGGAIQVVAIRPAAGRGPQTQLGACRECGARYRKSGTVKWIPDPGSESDGAR